MNVNKPAGERVPPQNSEAEICVLGSMLLEPNACGVGVELLREDDFYLPAHRLIFQEITSLFDQDSPTDLVILRENLEKKGLLDKAGGTELLATIIESVPTSANIEYYAGIVRDKSVLRSLIEKTNDIQRMVYNATGDKGEFLETREILEAGEQMIFEIADRDAGHSHKRVGEFIKDVFADILENPTEGVMSGFSEIDNLTNGFQPGQLIIIAGRPSMGKTTLVLNMLSHCAGNLNKPAALYTMEMQREQVVKNMMAARASVEGRKIQKGGNIFSDEEFQRLTTAADNLLKMPLYIDDTPVLTPLSLKARARRLKATNDIQILAIDYLQLMESGGRGRENRQQEISYISRSLKALARDLHIPVIALCQLSRGPEGRDDHRPRLSDLRESGAIEQDADLVFLLFRESYYKRDDEELHNKAEVSLAKHRNGETRARIQLDYISEMMRFEDPRMHFSESEMSAGDVNY